VPWEPLPGSAERDPSRVGDSLDRLVRHLGGPSSAAVGSLFGHWPELVGEQVAAHADPVSLRDGTLVIAVHDPAWATQLRFLEGEILGRVRAALGGADVDRLEVRVRRPEGGSRPDGRR